VWLVAASLAIALPALAQDTPPQQPPPPVSVPPPPPLPPPPPQVAVPSEGFGIEPIYWLSRESPVLKGGAADLNPDPGNLNFPGHGQPSYGAMLWFPAGSGNRIEVSYFRALGAGDTTASKELILFNQDFVAGDLLLTNYRIQAGKVALVFLSYPDPAKARKFRFYTVYEVQYAAITSTINAPLDVNASQAGGTKSAILPALGVKVEYRANEHFRLAARGTGFGIPHHATLYDVEADAEVQRGRFGFRIGGRAYHFKTSPQGDEYYSVTLTGPFVALEYRF